MKVYFIKKRENGMEKEAILGSLSSVKKKPPYKLG